MKKLLTSFLTSWLWATKSAHVKNSMRAGGSTGFFYKYALTENMALEADMMFRYRSMGIQNLTTGEKGNFRYLTIDVPLYFLHQAEIEQQTLYFGGGAFTSYGLVSSYKTDTRSVNPYKKDLTSGKAMMNRWDYGFVFIVGFEAKNHLQINFNFQMGLRNMLDDSFENVTMISGLVSVGVGYRF
jgi:hypothetical protein